jgi:tetratricopeptide (TPR) repeat protein
MAEATLPFPARAHAAVARALEWVWPWGAAWAYADAIAHAPRDPELHFLRGTALGRARRWPDAARSFAAAARLRPSSVEYQGALVVALDRAGRDRELVEALRRFAELRAGEGEVHVLLGAVLRRAGRKAEALRAFRLAVRLGPLPATRRFVLGEALLGVEGWQAALAAWNEARQLEAASGSVILHNAGRRSALNFHPGRPMDRVPRREPTPAAVGPIAWLRERRDGVRAAAASLLGRLRQPRRRDRVQVLRKAWRRVALLALLGAVPAAAAPPARPAGESAAAREQARLCERENLEAGALACRSALALGIGPARRGPVREILARHLVALERWDELVELLREGVQLAPENAEAWQRLGQILLFALDQPGEAAAALEVAVSLAPADASARVSLALALHASGRVPEASAAFEAALRLDPAVLDGRPAARAVREAIARGEPWP